MPLNLATPLAVSDIVHHIEITSFAVDLVRQEMYVGYQELNASNQVIADKALTIVQPDYTQAITDASTEANYNVYGAIKNALYAQIQTLTGNTGTIA
jgi:hypothetical protein